MKVLNFRSEDISFEKAFEEFQRYNRSKNLSGQTIDYYEQCFRYFGNFFPIENNCSLIQKETYQEYILYLKDHTTANENTVNSYLRGLRTMLHYFMELGYIESFKIQLPKVEQTIKKGYTDQELERLLKKPDIKKCSFAEYRNWVIENYLLRNREPPFHGLCDQNR